MKFYESITECINCNKKLHIVDMEEKEAIEECPYCGYFQKVIATNQYDDAQIKD